MASTGWAVVGPLGEFRRKSYVAGVACPNSARNSSRRRRRCQFTPVRGSIMKLAWSVLAASFALLPGLVRTQGQDMEGSKDHPLVSRYPGSYIVKYVQKEFDEFELPLGKAVNEKPTKSQHLEGKV